MPTRLPAYDLVVPGPTVAVAVYRTIRGPRHHGYAATITVDSVPTLTVTDRGTGSPVQILWKPRANRAALLELARRFPDGAGAVPQPSRRDDASLLTWIAHELAQHEYLARRLERDSRTRTVVLQPGWHPVKRWTEIPRPLDDGLRATLADTYPGARVWHERAWQPI